MSIYDTPVIATTENELISAVFDITQTAPIRYYVGERDAPLAYAKTDPKNHDLREMAAAAYRLAAAGKVYLFQRRARDAADSWRSTAPIEYFAVPTVEVPARLRPEPFTPFADQQPKKRLNPSAGNVAAGAAGARRSISPR